MTNAWEKFSWRENFILVEGIKIDYSKTEAITKIP